MNMKNAIRTGLLALCLLLTAGRGLSSAQTIDREHLSVEAYARCNDFLNSYGLRDQLLDSHVSGLVGIAAGLTTRPEDGDWYDWAYNYPTFGIGLSHDFAGLLRFKPQKLQPQNIDAYSRLGDIVNLYGWAQFDLIRTRTFRFGPAFELGLAYSDQTYHYKTNPNNFYIESHVFFGVGAGLHAEWFLTPQWAITAGAYLTHHSNAMITPHNCGTNELSFSGGARRYLAPVRFTPRSAARPALPEFPKGLHLQVAAAAGAISFSDEQVVNERYRYTDRTAPARLRAVLSAELVWRYSRLFATGIGAEAGYTDNRYRETDRLLKGVEDDPRNYSPFHVGVYLIQELHYKQLSAHVICGVYVLKRTGLEDRFQSIVQKAGMRYHFTRASGLFAGMDLRATHRGFTLEWALGYRF